MNALEHSIVVARGEAWGASLLATAALQATFGLISNRQEMLDRMSEYLNDTLNLSGPGKGDGDDAPNTLMRETARLLIDQQLDGMRRKLDQLTRK